MLSQSGLAFRGFVAGLYLFSSVRVAAEVIKGMLIFPKLNVHPLAGTAISGAFRSATKGKPFYLYFFIQPTKFFTSFSWDSFFDIFLPSGAKRLWTEIFKRAGSHARATAGNLCLLYCIWSENIFGKNNMCSVEKCWMTEHYYCLHLYLVDII